MSNANHRIFIAINLPEDTKQKLLDFQLQWPDLPARWTKKDNLHITLVFIGNTSNDELIAICDTVKEIAAKNKPFSIKLNKIIYGPPQQKKEKFWRPRMVWVEGKKNEALGKLQSDLENLLMGRTVFNKENRSYSVHITLARLKEWEFRRMEIEERPEINENISLNFKVDSIEVMESTLKRGGPEYTVLESANLGSD